MNPWSKSGIALYPPKYPLVGQNRIFNALHEFKQTFSVEADQAGFFVVVGDWGLGKTRLGYELVAETKGHIDQWVLNKNGYVAPNTDGRVLKPQLAEGILPLFVDYLATIDRDLASDTWVPKVAGEALALLWKRPKACRVSEELLDDLVAVLKARGIDLDAVRRAFESKEDWNEKLDVAMEPLRDGGVHTLWVIVDEVETPLDLKRNPEGQPELGVEVEDLNLIPQVIKEARYRESHPYVNFLLLCSLGMSDLINIGPNLRRSDLVTLNPNDISDILLYRQHLESMGMDVDYPEGTLEGVFVAANRNFGWVNRVMTSIHASLEGGSQADASELSAWQLIEQYARTAARADQVYDLDVLKMLSNVSETAWKPLVFGQVPVEVGPGLDVVTDKRLLEADIPGVGAAFATLSRIHIDERRLAEELVKPEWGFKPVEGHGNEYANRYTELDINEVLSALRAFSVGIRDTGDFVVYDDLEQFAEQLSTLYPRQRADDGRRIEHAADALFRIFKDHKVEGHRFVGPSFKLLKKIDVRMSTESRGISFFADPNASAEIEDYAAEQSATDKIRETALCRGMAKVLDNADCPLKQVSGLDGVRHVIFESQLVNPDFRALGVTGNGRATVVFCVDVAGTAKKLADMLGRVNETVHPIIVLFDADGDVDGFDREVRRFPLLQRCVIVRRLTKPEADFLIRYSGRDQYYDANEKRLSQNTHGILGSLRGALKELFQTWRDRQDEAGYVLSPIWYQNVPGKEDFYRGYRYLVAQDETVDALDPAECNLPGWNAVSLNNFNTAAKRNVDPPKGKSAPCLRILETEPYQPTLPASLVRVVQELRSQAGEDTLRKRFFFAAPDSEVKGSQISQIVEFLAALGVIVSPGSGQWKTANKAVFDDWRNQVSNWLDNTAPGLIDEIRSMFPGQADKLAKGFKASARDALKNAETTAKRVDFGFINATEPDLAALADLVSKTYEFETALLRVCPRDPHQSFECADQQIRTFQDNYASLSFWEKVQFLRWLQRAYAKKRDDLLHTIEEQLTDANHYATVEEYPFPIAPLTLPLKSIQNEMEMALAGESRTVRGHIKLQGYPLSIQHYLYQDDYTQAWGRLSRLADMVSKTSQEGLWQRFAAQHRRWTIVVEQFGDCEKAWNDLDASLKGSEAYSSDAFGELRSRFDGCRDQVDGGLKHDVDEYVNTHGELDLLDKLVDEIEASESQYTRLTQDIEAFANKIRDGLRAIIDGTKLEALNHLLRAAKEQEVYAPGLEPTYEETKKSFEDFNSQVSEQGRGLLEGRGRTTNWELWVEIYADLSQDKYVKKPGHQASLDELEAMGLITTKIVLKGR